MEGGGSLKQTRLQPKIPANREFHSFLLFKSRPIAPQPLSSATLRLSAPSSGTMRNGELILPYQGIYREQQGIISAPRLQSNLPNLLIRSAALPSQNLDTSGRLITNLPSTGNFKELSGIAMTMLNMLPIREHLRRRELRSHCLSWSSVLHILRRAIGQYPIKANLCDRLDKGGEIDGLDDVAIDP